VSAPIEPTSPSSLPPGVTVMTIRPLYTSRQVGAATFFGGPLGGSWLLAMNYRRLGAPGKARLTIVFGALASALLIVIAMGMHGSGSVLPIVSVFAMVSTARVLQGADVERHIALGGQRGSSWRAIGLGVASLAISLGAVFGIAYAQETRHRIVLGKTEVRYTDGATRAEAEAVGDTLLTLAAISPDRDQTIEVRRDEGRPVVEFVVQDFVLSTAGMKLQFHVLASDLSSKAFHGEPTDLWLTDDELRPRVKLDWTARPYAVDVDDEHHVLAHHDVGEAETQSAARVLEQEGFFIAGHRSELLLLRSGATRIVGLALTPAAAGDTDAVAAFRTLAAELSTKAFGDNPVDVWFLDDQLAPFHKLTWDTRPQGSGAPPPR
jgi:hypothetical protein